MASRAEVKHDTTQKATLQMLIQDPRPSVILVTDGTVARRRKLLERVIDRLREGTSVVLTGAFSSNVNPGQFKRLFTTVGLSWELGSYQRLICKLRWGAVGDRLAGRLASKYSVKAVFAKNVDASAA